MNEPDGKRPEAVDRGQALTLESVTAAIVVLAAIGFALQMTAVTPLSASTSSQHVENQLASTNAGILASADDTDALAEAVLYYNTTAGQFHGATDESYYRSAPPQTIEFFNVTADSLGEESIAYNVVVHYREDGTTETQRLVYQGEPSDHAVSASRTVQLAMDDRLVEEDGAPGPTLREVASSDDREFYVTDSAPGDNIYYSLVRVEVVAWRI